MKHRFSLLAVLVLIALVPAAHADGYVAFGVGPGTGILGEMSGDDSTASTSSRANRVALGYVRGALGLEVSLWSESRDPGPVEQPTAMSGTGVELKYVVRTATPVQAYVHGGIYSSSLTRSVERTYMECPSWWDDIIDNPRDPTPCTTVTTVDSSSHENGRMYMLGAGVQYTFGAGRWLDGTLWLDYSQVFAAEQNAGGVMGGISLGRNL